MDQRLGAATSVQALYDQRSETRHKVEEREVRLRTFSDGRTTTATLLNLSKSGAALLVTHLITPGQTVGFEIGSHFIHAEVRNLRWLPTGVLLGLRFKYVENDSRTASVASAG